MKWAGSGLSARDVVLELGWGLLGSESLGSWGQ